MKSFIVLLLCLCAFAIAFWSYSKSGTEEAFNTLISDEYIKKYEESFGENKEGFVSGQCPTTMIKKGNNIILYNPKMAKIPGVNPIVLSSLKDYEEYVKWQKASKLDCPILHLERVYDTQGEEKYEIRKSFMLDQPAGPLNHNLPIIQKRPSVSELLDASKSNNQPYNQNQFPSYDPYNQNVGILTQHDLDGPNPNTNLPLK